ncbi:formate dehydrogenase delta subunit [Pseudoxanthomonas sp. GM95]|uniref:formate dehydrogenase subunit delta n=1 Tax=Pseudoxanthomonas sp. GM95 TaxID=1881043 RepID=UPI0008D46E8F|nr:formate dehydrogenase subunit delta [Pseudoxanthomonas sp. GM95]SEL87256.1 formate dehydrogenase delta subunit [Pseudoxanthomonas sp. GM95]
MSDGSERTVRLVEMANDIAAYFQAEADPAAGAEGVRQHLVRFWEPGMRRKLLRYVREGGDGLVPLARDAVEGLDP